MWTKWPTVTDIISEPVIVAIVTRTVQFKSQLFKSTYFFLTNCAQTLRILFFYEQGIEITIKCETLHSLFYITIRKTSIEINYAPTFSLVHMYGNRQNTN